MKHFMALAVIVTMVMAGGFVNAAPRGGKAPGYKGTISTVGSEGFAMTTEDGKELDVLCSPNTKFMNGKEAGAPSDIKAGVTVSVQGGISGTQITATTVTIVPSHKKK